MSNVEPDTRSIPAVQSLYERVMSDPEAREAYYWAITADAYFSGDPRSPITQGLKEELKALLSSRGVRVSFLDNESCIEPELRICGIDYPYQGEDEIRLASARFLTREALDRMPSQPTVPTTAS